jgi:hypothetical protein
LTTPRSILTVSVIRKLNHAEVNILERRTAQLEDVAAMYGIPLSTVRKWAADRIFPGLVRRKGARRLYVDLEKFDAWFRSGEVEVTKEDA